MTYQTTGRKSLFAHENNEHKFNYGINEVAPLELEGVIVDVCGAHNPTTRFLKGQEFSVGIRLIIYLFEDKEIYDVIWNESYDCLRLIYGQDSNIIGRNIRVYPQRLSALDVRYANFSFAKVHKTQFPDESTLNLISARSIGGIPIDYSSNINAYAMNPSDGDGEEWSRIE